MMILMSLRLMISNLPKLKIFKEPKILPISDVSDDIRARIIARWEVSGLLDWLYSRDE